LAAGAPSGEAHKKLLASLRRFFSTSLFRHVAASLRL